MKMAGIEKIKFFYKQIINSGLPGRLLRAKFFAATRPIIVSWRLTNRCNQSCLYCRLWECEKKEQKTIDVLKRIDKLFSEGIRFFVFTGGEPLLREDIGQIIGYSSKKGIYVTLNTNGRLLRPEKKCLEGVNRLHLSLDGPEYINDYLRGRDSFKYTREALILAKNQKIPVFLTSVLSKYNLDPGNINFLLNFAEENKVKIGFQPASLNYLGSNQLNPFSPPIGEYKDAISYLMKCKIRGNRQIINSVSGLKHMSYFPEARKIVCFAEKLVLRIEADGKEFSCGWGRDKDTAGNTCSACWKYEPLEMNLAGTLRPEPVFNAAQMLFS